MQENEATVNHSTFGMWIPAIRIHPPLLYFLMSENSIQRCVWRGTPHLCAGGMDEPAEAVIS